VVAVEVGRSMLVASHGGTAALLSGAPVITGYGSARRGVLQHHGDRVNLSRRPRRLEALRRNMATARWCGGQNVAVRVAMFHAGETTNRGNIIT